MALPILAAACEPALAAASALSLASFLSCLFQLLLDLFLFLGELLELVGPLLGVRVLPRCFGLLEVLGLPICRSALELGLGVLELLDEPGEFAFAAVLDRVDQVLEVLTGLLLPGLGLAHLVLLEPLGGFAHLGGGPLLAALLGGLAAAAEAAKGSDSSSCLAISSICLLEVLEPLGDVAFWRSARLARSAFCSGREVFGRLAHQLGLARPPRPSASSSVPAP